MITDNTLSFSKNPTDNSEIWAADDVDFEDLGTLADNIKKKGSAKHIKTLILNFGYKITQGRLFDGDHNMFEGESIWYDGLSTMRKLKQAFPTATFKFIEHEAPSFWCQHDVNKAFNKFIKEALPETQMITLPEDLARMTVEGQSNITEQQTKLQFTASGTTQMQEFIKQHLN